jgi:hypothetical protein
VETVRPPLKQRAKADMAQQQAFAHRHDAAYQIGPESLRAFLTTRPLAQREQHQ